MSQEIRQESSNGKVYEKSKDQAVFRSLSKNPGFIEDDLQSTLYNPSRIQITRFAGQSIFLVKIGGPEYDSRITIGLSREQLEQFKGVFEEALTWAQIPKNTKVI